MQFGRGKSHNIPEDAVENKMVHVCRMQADLQLPTTQGWDYRVVSIVRAEKICFVLCMAPSLGRNFRIYFCESIFLVYMLGLTQSATTMAAWRSSIVLTRFRQRWNTKMNALYHRCFTQKSRCTVLGKNMDKTHDETWCSEDRNHCVVHTTCIQLETTADWIQIESGDAYEDHTNSSRLLWCEPTCPTQTISQMRKNY